MFRKIRSLLKHPFVYKRIVSESQTMITFDNGSEIHSLPGNNPDTVRGFSPTKAIVDEAAFVKDDLFTALEPSLAATNGDLELYSSPFGKRGRFYQSFSEDSFETYHVKSNESPLITEEFLQGMRQSKTNLEFLQEFEGEFLDEQDTYFSRELILDCIGEIEERHGPRDHAEYYLGVDCARYGLDETVYTIAELNHLGQVEIIFIKSTQKMPITDIIGRVQAFNQKWDFKAVYIDESGLGAGAVDSLKQRGIRVMSLDNQAGGVQFTLPNKEYLYKNLKLLMEQRKIKFPKMDKLINQLSDLQYEFTEAGHTKIHHPDNGHDDFPDSLALSVAGIGKKNYRPHISL